MDILTEIKTGRTPASIDSEPAAGREALESTRLLSGNQLAQYLGMSKKFVYKHVSSGRMPGVCRIGRLLRFDRVIIDKRLAAKNLLLEKAEKE